MKHCTIALAILISDALNALGTFNGVILQLSRASGHGESQQLALWSSSSLRSEASRVLQPDRGLFSLAVPRGLPSLSRDRDFQVRKSSW